MKLKPAMLSSLALISVLVVGATLSLSSKSDPTATSEKLAFTDSLVTSGDDYGNEELAEIPTAYRAAIQSEPKPEALRLEIPSAELRLLSDAGREALDLSFEALHFDSTRQQLVDAYSSGLKAIPDHLVMALHLDKKDSGDFETLKPKSADGSPASWVVKSDSGNQPILSLTHGLADGSVIRTWIEMGDIPNYEQDILYLHWLVNRMRAM